MTASSSRDTTLASVLPSIEWARPDVSVGGHGALVRGLCIDSRRVEPGFLFVARKGHAVDGSAFIPDALRRGASVVLAPRGCEGAVPGAFSSGSSVVYVRVDESDLQRAYACIAHAMEGDPSRNLSLVGVTGTNGKTSVTYFVQSAVDAAAGRPSCGVIGTTGNSFGSLVAETGHTTPDPHVLAATLRRMHELGARYVAMEVSSHALEQSRTHAARFSATAFLNLTQDHLDYHGTMEAYGRAKRKLFDENPEASAVICIDSPFGRSLADSLSGSVIRVSQSDQTGADVSLLGCVEGSHSQELRVRVGNASHTVQTRLIGRHNVENVLVSLGLIRALDLDIARAVSGLAGHPGAPGRLQRCDGEGDDIRVLVDYAHTPDALSKALLSLRPTTKGRLVVVFGCGGDRDSGKRSLMGSVAAELADAAIVTNDNPRSESPARIAEAIVDGILLGRGTGTARLKSFEVELDRARAIGSAIASASSGDTVLVAGKGHETYQILGELVLPFDDRDVCRAALQNRRGE